MSMTVARRNRRWTPELMNKMCNDVHAYRMKGSTNEDAFREMAPMWGLTPQGLSTRYYANLRSKLNKKVVPTPSVTQNTAPIRSMEEAIEVLKKLGVKVTLSF
jgi:hypothetical protein